MTRQGSSQASSVRKRLVGQAGLTLVEVCVALGLVTAMSAGVYAVGLQARKLAEHNRIATEARSLAKERLEEMMSVGLLNLVRPSCTLTAPDTIASSLGGTFTRTPRIIWHAADRGVVASSNAVYAEVHVDVAYRSAVTRQTVADTYSCILQ